MMANKYKGKWSHIVIQFYYLLLWYVDKVLIRQAIKLYTPGQITF